LKAIRQKMKIAYLFFAYKNPRLIQKTIQHLSCDDSGFFVHIDAKCDLAGFAAIKGDNIFFTNTRLPVYWGEFSGVRAIQLLMQQALAQAHAYDYLVLLSGSEFPLKSRDYIHSFFEANRGTEFISMVKMPSVEAGKPISRINTLRVQSRQPVRRLFFRILARVGFAQRDYRKYLGNLEPYSGHTWWALTRQASEYILDFDRSNPHVAGFFENTFAPEEMFFHTILGNSPFKSRTRRNLVYEDWSARGSHPAMIDEQHIASFAAQEKVALQDAYGSGEVLFARKFSDDNLDMVRRIEATMN
jgi:hypothetical protein